MADNDIMVRAHTRRRPRCSRCGRTGHNVTSCEAIEEASRHAFLYRNGVNIPRGHRLVALGPDEEAPEDGMFLGFELPFQHTAREQE